MLLLDTTRANL